LILWDWDKKKELRHNRSQPPFLRYSPTEYRANIVNLSQMHPSDLVNLYRARSTAIVKGLEPGTAAKVSALFEDALSKGILLLIYSGSRDFAEQWELRKKFLAGGPLAAKPGESWHNYKRAVDAVPITPTGVAAWDSPQYFLIKDLAVKHGLKSGYSFGDKPHLYNDSGASLWLLKQASSGWQQYHTLESQMAPGAKVKTETDYIMRDNLIIGKKILLWGLGGVVAYGTYRYYRQSIKQ